MAGVTAGSGGEILARPKLKYCGEAGGLFIES